MRKFLKAAVAATILTVGTAQASVLITFDGLAASPFATDVPFFVHGDEFYQNGFYFDPFSNQASAQPIDLVGSLVDGTDVASTCFGVVCPTNNPTTFYTGLNDGVLYMGRLSGEAFKIKSFDASFIGGAGNVIPGTSLILRMQGTKYGGGTLTGSFNLAGLDGAGQLNFSNFNTTGAFANQQFTDVYIFGLACDQAGSCSAFSSDKGQFAIDNLNLDVPEPASFALTGLALLAAVGVTRRRRNSAV